MRIQPGLEEGLVATGPVSAQETADLDAALKAFHDLPPSLPPESDFADFAPPLEHFVQAHPDSHWNAPLLLNIGLGYYRSGYYSRTFAPFARAWELGKDAPSYIARLQAQRALGELAEMHARLGHASEVEAALAEAGKRPTGGLGRHLMENARAGLLTFRMHPEIGYLCGPLALRGVLETLKASPAQVKVAEDARSGPHGVSLSELSALATKAGLKHVLIRRLKGQAIPVPSVIHWKVNHYAAIVGRHGGLYEVRDPTFGEAGGALLTARAIEEEGSGYYLVPARAASAQAKAGWHKVAASSPEAKAVYGMGVVTMFEGGMVQTTDAKITGNCTMSGTGVSGMAIPGSNAPQNCNNCPGCGGPSQQSTPSASMAGTLDKMTMASAQIDSVSLNLADTAVGYRPQIGMPSLTTLTYNSQDDSIPMAPSFSNLGPRWTHGWLSYIVYNSSPAFADQAKRIAAGGGYVVPPGYNASNGYYTPDVRDNSQLVRIPPAGPITQFTRLMPDGSTEVFALSNGVTGSNA